MTPPTCTSFGCRRWKICIRVSSPKESCTSEQNWPNGAAPRKFGVCIRNTITSLPTKLQTRGCIHHHIAAHQATKEGMRTPSHRCPPSYQGGDAYTITSLPTKEGLLTVIAVCLAVRVPENTPKRGFMALAVITLLVFLILFDSIFVGVYLNCEISSSNGTGSLPTLKDTHRRS